MGTWARRTVGLLVLVVLCAAPALATTCELLCDARARASAAASAAAPGSTAARHGSSCHESLPVAGTRVSAGAADCAFHLGGVVEVAAALSPARADGDLVQTPIALASSVTVPGVPVAARAPRPWLGSPPGPPLPPRSLTVLRV